jgi:hypothetical protein
MGTSRDARTQFANFQEISVMKRAGTSEERSEKDEPALVSAVGGAGSAMLFSAAAAI